MTIDDDTDRLSHWHGRRRHTHAHAGPHRHLLRWRAARPEPPAPGPLADRVYRRLYAAQVVALAGTGLTTVALSLLAYDLAGDDAGAVLGAALALKMVAYVGVSPLFAAVAPRFDRRRMLIALDVVRAGVLVALPFVDEVWQALVLIFVVNACAAGFTPAFHATIPAVLVDEQRYTRALSLSRVAYDLADLLAPATAAALLLVMDFEPLFVMNAAAFLVSASLISSVTLPRGRARPATERTWAAITAGAARFARTRALRVVLAFDVAAAAGSAMVIVNTVVLVRDDLDLGQSAVAAAFAVAGAGSILTALLLPAVVDRRGERAVMLPGACAIGAGLVAVTVLPGYAGLLGAWLVVGAGLSAVQTPIGRILTRCSTDADRDQVFAAQFALSHACWLLTYPLAGVLGTLIGLDAIALVLAGLALAAAALATVHGRSGPPRLSTGGAGTTTSQRAGPAHPRRRP